jgi:3-methyladenine DNA glycosylase AlkD
VSDLLDRLTALAEARRDPGRALAMRAYMRDKFPFLGLASGERDDVLRQATRDLPPPTEDELVAFALACWERDEREYQYMAVRHLRRNAGRCSPALLGTVEHLVTTKSWWGTVDELASHVVGTLVTRHPELVLVMDRWIAADDHWLARTAILHQLRYGPRTDQRRLFAYCLARAADTDFFIRKAIGWALRTHARTAPTAVLAFVSQHEGELSGLSRREALKHLASATPPP